MVSELGQGAAAYSARAARSRRPTRLSSTLSGLAQIGEGSGSQENSESFNSPKRWVRDSPGSVNELGEVVRPGSPLRLSSSMRTAVLAGNQRRGGFFLRYKSVFYYGLLLFPILAVIPMMLSKLRSLNVADTAPEIPSSVLNSGEVSPALLQFLQENGEHVARLSSRVADLERARTDNEKTIQILHLQLTEQTNAQGKLLSEVKSITVQKVPTSAVNSSELEKLQLALNNAKAELTGKIEEQRTYLQELAAKRFSSVSVDVVEELIERALYRHLADGTELVDYALESTGGSVISVSGTHTGSIGLLGLATSYLLSSRKSEEMIRPQITPGQCWPMTGQSGWALLSLSDSITPTAITLEHVAPEIAPHFESAPREFSLFAVNGTGESATTTPLGSWQYRFPMPGQVPVIQTFKIANSLDFPVSTVNFTINSNYGGNYTCIYRVRVHGKRQS